MFYAALISGATKAIQKAWGKMNYRKGELVAEKEAF